MYPQGARQGGGREIDVGGSRLVRRPGGCVFEFSADEFVPSRDAEGGGGPLPWSRFRYHVAAPELGFPLPWFAVAVQRTDAPSQRLYPGRRGAGLGLPGRLGRHYMFRGHLQNPQSQPGPQRP